MASATLTRKAEEVIDIAGQAHCMGSEYEGGNDGRKIIRSGSGKVGPSSLLLYKNVFLLRDRRFLYIIAYFSSNVWNEKGEYMLKMCEMYHFLSQKDKMGNENGLNVLYLMYQRTRV